MLGECKADAQKVLHILVTWFTLHTVRKVDSGLERLRPLVALPQGLSSTPSTSRRLTIICNCSARGLMPYSVCTGTAHIWYTGIYAVKTSTHIHFKKSRCVQLRQKDQVADLHPIQHPVTKSRERLKQERTSTLLTEHTCKRSFVTRAWRIY